MRLGLTGTRSFDPERHGPQTAAFFEQLLLEFDSDFHTIEEVTSGGSRGFDEWAGAWWFGRLPGIVHRVVLPATDSGIFDQMKMWFPLDGRVDVELMPDGTTPRDRNTRIVDHSDLLAAVPLGPIDNGQPYSGTRMTYNIARRRSGILLAVSEL